MKRSKVSKSCKYHAYISLRNFFICSYIFWTLYYSHHTYVYCTEVSRRLLTLTTPGRRLPVNTMTQILPFLTAALHACPRITPYPGQALLRGTSSTWGGLHQIRLSPTDSSPGNIVQQLATSGRRSAPRVGGRLAWSTNAQSSELNPARMRALFSNTTFPPSYSCMDDRLPCEVWPGHTVADMCGWLLKGRVSDLPRWLL